MIDSHSGVDYFADLWFPEFGLEFGQWFGEGAAIPTAFRKRLINMGGGGLPPTLQPPTFNLQPSTPNHPSSVCHMCARSVAGRTNNLLHVLARRTSRMFGEHSYEQYTGDRVPALAGPQPSSAKGKKEEDWEMWCASSPAYT